MAKVIIYTKPDCPYCKAAKDHYRSEGIPFEEIDVYAVRGAKEEAIRLAGGKAIVPVIVEEGKVLIGFGGG
jgi:glutaredoxin 3